MAIDVSKIRPGDWVDIDERIDYEWSGRYGRCYVRGVNSEFGFIVIGDEHADWRALVREKHIVAHYPVDNSGVSPAVKVGDWIEVGGGGVFQVVSLTFHVLVTQPHGASMEVPVHHTDVVRVVSRGEAE